MLDFKELNTDGTDFELLIREILFNLGYKVYWSGKGPDSGQDLLCIEEGESLFAPYQKKWLIQCKHNAHANQSVSSSAVNDILDSCAEHAANGYLLACTTQPSSTLVKKLNQITQNERHDITAIYWDYVFIEKLLSSAKLWPIAQRFFPKSTEASSWKVYATDKPNHWVVNYKGYYFYLTNRIGSNHNFHFDSIVSIVTKLELIKLSTTHFLRIRAVHYDDKNGCYTWFIDYMHPFNSQPDYQIIKLQYMLGHEYAAEDGQIYCFDIMSREYSIYSDHYDKDHYNYYTPYMDAYLFGSNRTSKWDSFDCNIEETLQNMIEFNQNQIFDRLVSTFQSLPFLHLDRSTNAQIEEIDKYYKNKKWGELVSALAGSSERILSAWFFFDIQNVELFFKLISYFPLDPSLGVFRLTKAYIYTPILEESANNIRCQYDSDGEELFELTISILPNNYTNVFAMRKDLNKYFEAFIDCINTFKSDHQFP